VKLNAEIREQEVTHGVQESNSSSDDGSGNDLGQDWSDGGHWEQDEVDDGEFSDSSVEENRSEDTEDEADLGSDGEDVIPCLASLRLNSTRPSF
jgi:hypothetical protein